MTTQNPADDLNAPVTVIVGAGRLGAYVASELLREGHLVYAFDLDPEKLGRLPKDAVQSRRLMPIAADGTRVYELRKAPMARCSAFIAATGSDTLNALSAQVARHIFEVAKVVCVMSDPKRKNAFSKMGLNAVSGFDSTSNEILNVLKA